MVEEKKEGKQEEKVEETKKEEEEKKLEIPKNLQKIVKEIEEMKMVDLAALVKVLEEKFGVSAASMAMAAPAAASAAEGGKAEETAKATVNVILTGLGDKKIEVIKAVKDITQKGLKDCKDLVDAAANEPQIVKEGVKREEAEKLKKKLEATGAKVELK